MPIFELGLILSNTVVPAVAGLITAAVTKANGINAMGPVAWVDADDFLRSLKRADAPLVFHSQRGRAEIRHEYLGSCRGLLLYTKSDLPLHLPAECETVRVKSIWRRRV
ncbi:hypothetical protein HN371_28430 [Candidatus Poribacteria bacterium]|jgi:hypothetical protein|nr:hypothetical protein [Candidatus Poribacteria bacterium]MBT5710879.1 hypothetical protein [Candidatus Poribacteria bacterium]MBT7805161.1 hypothetical protein [Candidatus Poribacteria bacterium]